MPSTRHPERLAGITYTRQFPNPAEPVRSLFVAEQVAATADAIDWRVIAPLPWPQRFPGDVPRHDELVGVPVDRPRYFVLPRRLLFTRVAASMARVSRADFERILAQDRPAFVHAHELYPSGAAAAKLCATSGTPLVVSVHGSDLYTNLVRPDWKREIERVVEAADAIVAVSTSLAADLASAFPRAAEKTVVVPDTFDAARFAFAKRDAARDTTLRLLTVGRLSAEKGFDVAIAAVGLLRSRGVDARLRVVGGGRLHAALESAAAAAGLADHITFTGRLGGAELEREYAAADLYLQPSRREGFGVAIVEALATGLPVVATCAGGPSDIVTPSDGALVAPGDAAALADAIADIAARRTAFDGAAIAASALERFGPAAVGARLVDVYRSVVKGE